MRPERTSPAPEGWTLMGRAVLDHHRGVAGVALTIVSDVEEDRLLPASHFFRTVGEMPEVEQEALRLARGRVLDVGACAGAHALALQTAGLPVTGLDVSRDAVEVMRARGVTDARAGDLGALPPEERWDTVLLLMNGTTLVGSPAALVDLLTDAAARLAPGGAILVDSTDLRDEDEDSTLPDGRYVGEVQMQVVYREHRSDPFPVLYAAPDLLAQCAAAAGLTARVVHQAPEGSYLAELTPA